MSWTISSGRSEKSAISYKSYLFTYHLKNKKTLSFQFWAQQDG